MNNLFAEAAFHEGAARLTHCAEPFGWHGDKGKHGGGKHNG